MIIDRFKDEHALLSNFAETPIFWADVHFPTAEHAFQAAKTLDVGERQLIAAANTPGAAKRLGRHVLLRPGWDELKLFVMRDILWTKFTTRRECAEALWSTGTATLIEGNTWHDQFWGDCRCGKRELCDDPGTNYLGRLLMKLRLEIKDEYDRQVTTSSIERYVTLIGHPDAGKTTLQRVTSNTHQEDHESVIDDGEGGANC